MLQPDEIRRRKDGSIDDDHYLEIARNYRASCGRDAVAQVFALVTAACFAWAQQPARKPKSPGRGACSSIRTGGGGRFLL